MIDFDISSPPAFCDPVERLLVDGAAVFRGLFEADEIRWARQLVLEHADLMPNTRCVSGSRHLAGFHRFPTLEPLQTMITQNLSVQGIVGQICGEGARTIGLSDITVNRSQQWHKDLLRGDFQSYLGEGPYCASWYGTVFKVIVYLQDGASLKIIPGSHLQDIDLRSDAGAVPSNEENVVSVPVKAGDAVVIDICTTHRGSDEDAFTTPEARDNPKILISTVFGKHNAALADRMELGNAVRLSRWMAKHYNA